jgi:hypothetical protein
MGSYKKRDKNEFWIKLGVPHVKVIFLLYSNKLI